MTGLIVSDRTGENIERGSFDRTGDSAGVSLNRPLYVATVRLFRLYLYLYVRVYCMFAACKLLREQFSPVLFAPYINGILRPQGFQRCAIHVPQRTVRR